jgi:hypothetical protein
MSIRVEEVPELEGKVSLPKAAKVLDVSRQRVFQMGAEEGKLPSLRRIAGAGERPAAYVLDTIEVLQFRAKQCALCREAVASGVAVNYCTHTDLLVPEPVPAAAA